MTQINNDIIYNIMIYAAKNTKIIEAFPGLIKRGKKLALEYWRSKHPIRLLSAYVEEVPEEDRVFWIESDLRMTRMPDLYEFFKFRDDLFHHKVTKANYSATLNKIFLKDNHWKRTKTIEIRKNCGKQPIKTKGCFPYENLHDYFSTNSICSVREFFEQNAVSLRKNTATVIKSIIDCNDYQKFKIMINCQKFNFDSYIDKFSIDTPIFYNNGKFLHNINSEILTYIISKYYKNNYQNLFEHALEAVSYTHLTLPTTPYV